MYGADVCVWCDFPYAVQKWLSRLRCHLRRLVWTHGSCIRWGCTLFPAGEYSWSICVVAVVVAVYQITHIPAFNSPLSGTTWVSKLKPVWILLKQETVSGSGISWAICKSAPHSRQITMPAPHHSVFYRLDDVPATQPTASKHWRRI